MKIVTDEQTGVWFFQDTEKDRAVLRKLANLMQGSCTVTLYEDAGQKQNETCVLLNDATPNRPRG